MPLDRKVSALIHMLGPHPYIIISIVGLVIINILASILLKKEYNKIRELPDFRRIIKKLINDVYYKEKKYRLLLLILLIIGFCLRLLFINRTICMDEAYTYYNYMSKSILYSLTHYHNPNNHILNSFLGSIFYHLFGNSLWIIRLPVFMAGFFIIPAAYILGCNYFNRNIGIIFSGFMVSSYMLIDYSTQARGYIFIVLIVILLSYLASIIKNREPKGSWLVFIILSCLGLFCISITIYPLVAIFLWLIISIYCENKAHDSRVTFLKKLLLSYLLIVSFTFVIYSPIMDRHGPAQLFYHGWAKSFSRTGIIHIETSLHDLVGYWSFWNRGIPLVLALILLIIFIFGIINYKKLSRINKIPFIVISLSICLIVTFFQPVRISWPRLWVWLLPLYFLTVSSGIGFLIDFLKNEKIKWLVTVLIVFIPSSIFIFFSIQKQLNNESFIRGYLPAAEEIVDKLESILTDNSRVVTKNPVSHMLRYYFDKKGLSNDYLVLSQERYLSIQPDILFIVGGRKEDLEHLYKVQKIEGEPILISEYFRGYIWVVQ